MNAIEKLKAQETAIPAPLREVLRGVGQVFFQESAISGAFFVLGIAWGSPLMALGAVVGSVIGTATARVRRFDENEVAAGIYGFNSTLVGIATFFFFQPSVTSVGLMLVGCVVAALATYAMRRYVPFPTYTTPFIIVTWVLFFLGSALSAARVAAGDAPASPRYFFVESVGHGIGQVMFQARILTGLLFLVGIALGSREHALWVLLGSIVGMLVASHHTTSTLRALDPERLVDRAVYENIALGLYGYNATLAAVALFLWRRSLIPPLLGILLSVPLTELVPTLGLPALTAPFVLATWLVLAFGWLDEKLFPE